MAGKLSRVICYDCVIGRHHLVARCPHCEVGVLLATCGDDTKGIIECTCNDCGNSVAFYVLMHERKAWLLAEPVEIQKPQPTKKAEEPAS